MRIEIALTTYNDIFSDFDIRDYRQRQLSKDFLDELRIRMFKKTDALTTSIIMMLDARQRNEEDERLIINRLKAFFGERYSSYTLKRRKNIAQACVFGALGIGFFLAAQMLSQRVGNLFRDFLLIPSWYLVWSAFEKIFNMSQEISKKREYYKNLSNAAIEFRNTDTPRQDTAE